MGRCGNVELCRRGEVFQVGGRCQVRWAVGRFFAGTQAAGPGLIEAAKAATAGVVEFCWWWSSADGMRFSDEISKGGPSMLVQRARLQSAQPHEHWVLTAANCSCKQIGMK